MNPVDFCYWLQGAFEMHDTKSLSEKQTKIVKNHLNLVFLHSIDPDRDAATPVAPEKLHQAHDGIRNTPLPNDKLLRC